MGRVVNVRKGKQGFQRAVPGLVAPSVPAAGASGRGPRRQVIARTAGMTPEQINSVYDAYHASMDAAELAERRRGEVEWILAEQEARANAGLEPGRERIRDSVGLHVRKCLDAYDSLPAGEQVVLSDDQVRREIEFGDPRLARMVLLADARTVEAKSRIIVGNRALARLWGARDEG